MPLLYHGDCNEEMSQIEDKSIDLIFTDLPYGQVSCEWDKKIDLTKMWEHFMRIKKLNTPIFFTCSTKFGVEIINSSPKKCPFRYDIVWVKSAPAGFLSAKKMPMRKHEMIYVFYEKLPFYDLSSHKHKFKKDGDVVREVHTNNNGNKSGLYGGKLVKYKEINGGGYDPPLPTSVIKGINNTYNTEGRKKPLVREEAGKYDPPLPTSVQSEDVYNAKERFNNGKLKKHPRHLQKGDDPIYDPPLPNSILEVKSQRGKHSTQKPVDLMKWVLKYYSKEGDVVLDNCMGSGSTGAACAEMNREFIGIEMNPEIFEIACERLYE